MCFILKNLCFNIQKGNSIIIFNRFIQYLFLKVKKIVILIMKKGVDNCFFNSLPLFSSSKSNLKGELFLKAAFLEVYTLRIQKIKPIKKFHYLDL